MWNQMSRTEAVKSFRLRWSSVKVNERQEGVKKMVNVQFLFYNNLL